MSLRELLIPVLFVVTSLSLFIKCSENENPVTPVNNNYPDSLYVIQPRVASTYHPGDTLVIKWKYPSNWSYTQVKLRLYKNSLNNPVRWLTPNGIASPTSEYRWVIQSTDTGNNCNIIVSEYDENLQANSGVFTVSPR